MSVKTNAILVASVLLLLWATSHGQLTAPAAWDGYDSRGLVDLGAQLRADGSTAAQMRELLVDYIATRHLGNASTIRAVPIEHWRHFVWDLQGEMDATEKATWASTLKGAYVATPEAAATVRCSDLVHLTETLVQLGDTDAGQLLATRVTSGSDWQVLSAPDMASMTEHLRRLGGGGTAARREVVAHIRNQLPSVCQAADMAPVLLKRMVWNLGKELSAADRVALITGLRQAYASDQAAVAGLGSTDLYTVAALLNMLGDRKAGELLVNHVSSSSDWKALTPTELVEVLVPLHKAKAVGRPAVVQIASHVETAYLADAQAARSVAPRDWEGLIWKLHLVLSDQRKAQWRAGLRAAYAATPEGCRTLS